MRLTCPSCGARYEVAESLLPPEGREVQCSNCTTTWFQPGRGAELPEPPPVTRREPALAAPATGPRAQVDADADPGAGPDADPGADRAAGKPGAYADADGAPPDQAGALAAALRPALDPALRSILAQEAEREVRLRRAEAGPVETQAEMPLAPTPGAADRPRGRDPSRPEGRAEASAPTPVRSPVDGAMGSALVASRAAKPAAAPGLRQPPAPARDLFPDIDEINSTLRDTGDRSGRDGLSTDIDTLEAGPRRRRGTRIGFGGVLALSAACVALYAQADRVAVTAPALAPAVAEYVQAVDSARFWLDGLARDLARATAGG